MELLYPAYYQNFVCLAQQCPDSCCKEWCVDVDDDSAVFYRGLSGPLGERLRQVLQDTENGTIMVTENGRCPMWRQDGLCQIHAELGHDALCQVCREFPRLHHDYGDFTEFGLELSCPEAARLILSDTEGEWIAKILPKSEAPEYDTEIMDILRRSRREFLDFLGETTLSFPQILSIFLLYAHEVQGELDGGSPASVPALPHFPAVPAGDMQSVIDFFTGLEILTPQWKARLRTPIRTPKWASPYKALLRYFISRYWLQAISDYDVLCRAKFAVAACLLIGHLGGDLVETAQLFSKEIENNFNNVETILDGAYTATALTDSNLLGILLG